jgi:hypothetical protein
VLAGLDEGESDCIAAAHQLHAEANLGRGTLVTVACGHVDAFMEPSGNGPRRQQLSQAFDGSVDGI